MQSAQQHLLKLALVALALAAPIEAAKIVLTGMMFDPGPHSSAFGAELLEWQWAFFHFIGFYFLDRIHRLLGTEYRAIIAAYLIAYVQTAVAFFIATLAGQAVLRNFNRAQRSPQSIGLISQPNRS